MTENPQPKVPAQQPAGRHAPAEQPPEQQPEAQRQEQPATSSGDDSGTFADGSTKEQQDRLVKEADDANAETKRYADQERKARQEQSGS